MSDCPPGFVLERMLLGELEGTASEPWLRHTASCDNCRARIEELRAQDQRFMASPFAQDLRGKLVNAARPRPSLRGWPVAAAPALLAVAALAFVVVSRPRVDSFTSKGGAGVLSVIQQREGRARPFDRRDLRAQDALQLRWAAARGGELIAVGVDRSGSLTVLYPDGATRSAPIRAGEDVELGGRIILSAAEDGAVICVLFDQGPIAADDAARAECLEQKGRVVGALTLSLGAEAP